MTAKVGTNVTALGIISVARIKKKTAFRPRAGMRASAYPAMLENSIWRTSVTTAIMAEFTRPVSIGASGSVNSVRKLSQCGDGGSQAQCDDVIWSSVISALRRMR